MDLSLIAALLIVGGLYFLDSRQHTPLPGRRVYLFGDSLAQGLTGPMRSLADADGVPFAADSQVGSTTNQWLSRGPDGAQAFGATHVLISLGTNDGAGNPGHQAAFADQAKEIVSALQAQGVSVVWLLPPAPMPFDMGVINAGIRASGAKVAVPPSLQRYDRIHPTPTEFSRWASETWQALQRVR